jgi:DNA-binding IclR family transcriptional regulator
VIQKRSTEQKILELFVKGFSPNFSISGVIKQIRMNDSTTFRWLKVLKSGNEIEISKSLKIFLKFKE